MCGRNWVVNKLGAGANNDTAIVGVRVREMVMARARAWARVRVMVRNLP
jgi:hypothetical protein